MKKIRLSLALLLTLFVFSCNTDDNSNDPGDTSNDFIENFGSQASRDFIGQIVDPNNDPIQNATVKIGSSTAQTDVNGVFIINNASVYEKFAYIKAEKAGFINGSRSIVPTDGKNNIKIMMIPAQVTETVASGSSSEVALYTGTKVVLDGAYEDEDGNAYSGNVQVSLFHLTASDDNLSSLMPGMLYAEDESGDETVLETFGMVHVQLTGTGGQKLQIADGHTAQITVRVDDTQTATAPSTIPLWHFDEEYGYWKEDGTATKQGNYYVGTVSHFSWWNCDAQFPTVSLCATIVTPSGEPIANTAIGISRAGMTYPSMGYTNSNGEVCGLIPANETLTMTVYDNCGAVASTSSIGPFSADTDLGNIVLAAVQTTVVTGMLLQCDNSNVTEGYVYLSYGNTNLVANVTDGTFNFTTLICESSPQEFTLAGYDYENNQTTGSMSYTFATPTTVIGNIPACTAINEYVSYQLDGEDTVFLYQIQTGLNNSGLGFQVSSTNGNDQGLYIWGTTIIPGTYTSSTFSLEGNLGVIPGNVIGDDTLVYQLNNFGAVGEYIDMTFSGTYLQYNGTNTPVTRTLTGVVHVIRDN